MNKEKRKERKKKIIDFDREFNLIYIFFSCRFDETRYRKKEFRNH